MESTGPLETSVRAASPVRRSAVTSGGARTAPSWVRAVLAIPLLLKLIGANALVVGATLAVALATYAGDPQGTRTALLLAGALLVAFTVNLALVYVALKPLKTLETTAERVWRGDLTARVPPSAVADRDIERIGGTLNSLLDSLTADRERARQLALEVIRTGDRERARIAKELHDSTAQMLAAITLELSAASRDSTDKDLSGRLDAIRSLASGVLEEVRTLAQTVHPRVLDDLGLPAALRNLAREVQSRDSGVQIEVTTEGSAERLSRETASVLYRVAQEGVRNALQHGVPRNIDIRVAANGHHARLEINDDGRGFDMVALTQHPERKGLFALRERVSLVDGRFEVISHPGSGTRLLATVPFTTSSRP